MFAPILLLVEGGDGVDDLIVLAEVDVWFIVGDVVSLGSNVVMVAGEVFLSVGFLRAGAITFKLMVNLGLLLVRTSQLVDDLPKLGAAAG